MASTYTNGAKVAAPATPKAGALGYAGRCLAMGRGRVGRLVMMGRRAPAGTAARGGGIRYATKAAGPGVRPEIRAGGLRLGVMAAGPAVGSRVSAAGPLRLGFPAVRLASVPAVVEVGPLGLVAARVLPAVGGPLWAPVTVTRAGDEVLALPEVWRAMAWPSGGYIGGQLAALAVLRGEPVGVVDGLATVAGRVLVDASGKGVEAADLDAAYSAIEQDYQDLVAVAGGLTVPAGGSRAEWLEWLRLRASADISGRAKLAKGAALDRLPALMADLRWLEVRA